MDFNSKHSVLIKIRSYRFSADVFFLFIRGEENSYEVVKQTLHGHL